MHYYSNNYKTDGLLLIGGIQNPNRANEMQFLYYRSEKPLSVDEYQPN